MTSFYELPWALAHPCIMKIPLLCKEGRGEVEGVSLYPTQPPLTKGRRHYLSK